MAALRLELEITTVEPSGGMVFVEGHAPGGIQVGLMIPPGSLLARVGQRLAVSLEAPAQDAAPPMRERLARAAAGATEVPRSAATTTPSSSATASSTQITDAVLAEVFGKSPAAERERDVNEEMDALFGRRR